MNIFNKTNDFPLELDRLITKLTSNSSSNTLFAFHEQMTEITDLVARFVINGRCRYYDMATEYLHNEERQNIVLIAFSKDAHESSILGYKILYKDTSFGKKKLADSDALYAFGEYVDSKTSNSEVNWIDKLGLRDKKWIDIGLVDNYGKPLGLICIDWPKHEDTKPSRNDEIALGFLSTNISFLIERLTHHAINSISAKIDIHESSVKGNAIPKKQKGTEYILERTCKELCNSLNCQSVSIFKHDWNGDILKRKIISNSSEHQFERSEERYSCSSDKSTLVVKAWSYLSAKSALNKRDSIYYVDFSDVAAADFSDQWAHQNDYMQFIKTLKNGMYHIINQDERKYMIRILSGNDRPGNYFTNYHADILTAVSQKLAITLDNRIAKKRLKFVQDATSAVVSVKKNIRSVLEALAKGFHYEGIHAENSLIVFSSISDPRAFLKPWNEYLLKTKTKNSNESYFPDFNHIPNFLNDDVWHKGDDGVEYFFRQIKSEISEDFHNKLSRAFSKERESPGNNSYGIIGVRIFDSNSSCIILMRICNIAENDTPISSIDDFISLYPERWKMMETFSQIIKNSLEISEANSILDNAYSLVGLIGHEVSTPMSLIQSLAIKSFRTISEKIDDDYIRFEISDYIREFQENIGFYTSSLSIAVLTAQMHKGRLQLMCQEADLRSIMQRAIKILEQRGELDIESHNQIEDADDISVSEIGRHGRHFKFILHNSTLGIEPINCDPYLLLHVFLNIFRNAIKYSLPRYSKQYVIKIDVQSVHQTVTEEIVVSNWGVGIPDHEKEKIFSRFYRIDRMDKYRSIRGMGLGLYLARQIMRAHKGDIVCSKSTSMLGDPKRREMLEGFMTEFRIIIPTKLPQGMILYKFDDI